MCPSSSLNCMPLVIGVVAQPGLSNLDKQHIKQAAVAYFEGLREKYPATPLLLISTCNQLAERVFIDVALTGAFNAELIIVLTVPRGRDGKLQGSILTEEDRSAVNELLKNNRYLDVLCPNKPPSDYSVRDYSVPDYSDPDYSVPDYSMSGYSAPEYSAPDYSAPDYSALDESASLSAEVLIARTCQALVAIYQGICPEDIANAPAAVRIKRGQSDNSLITETKSPAATKMKWGLHGLLTDAQIACIKDPFEGPDEPLEDPETGPVWWITPNVVAGRVGLIREIAPLRYENPEDIATYFERFADVNKDRLNRFNYAAWTKLSQKRESWIESRSYLLPERDVERLALPTPLRALRDAFATADSLALHYQSFSNKVIWLCIIFLASALFGFSVYAHIIRDTSRYVLLVVYLFFLAIADCVLLSCFWWREHHALHQDFRALAEGIRVQFAWRLAGLCRFAPDFYLSQQKDELEWIRYAAKGQAIRSFSKSDSDGADQDRFKPSLDLAQEHWVLDQIKYYRGATFAKHAHHLFRREIVAGLLFVSLGISFFVAGRGLLHPHWSNSRSAWCHIAMILLAIAALVALAHFLIKLFENRKQRKEESKGLKEARHISNFIKGLPPFENKPSKSFGECFARLLGFGKPPSFLRLRIVALFVGIGVGVLITFCLTVFSGANLPKWEEDDELWHDWMIVAMVAMVFLPALLQWDTENRALDTLHRRYHRMLLVFSRAYILCAKHRNNPELASTVLVHLGSEALVEHAEWLRLHREHPRELPRLEL